jgi:hypothetical protein
MSGLYLEGLLMNGWGVGNSIGKLYILDENDLSRVGDCWMKGRLHVGDVVLCTAHSGDCFNDYVLIRSFHNGLEAILGATFGAYVFGTELDWQPSDKEYHLLLAGGMVRNGINQHPLSTELKVRLAS